MPGSVASSPQRTPEMIWTSPCRHSKWWGQSWDLSEPFWGRRGGSWLSVPGPIAHSEETSYFGGRPYRCCTESSPKMLHGVLTLRSPPMRVLTVLGLLAGAIGSLNAQRGGQVEIGGYGSHTRHDSRVPLDTHVGGRGPPGDLHRAPFTPGADGNGARPLSQ